MNNEVQLGSGVFYNARGFPTRSDLAALYLYFDKLVVIPPAQSIVMTHYLGNTLPNEDCLDTLSDVYHDAEAFERASKPFTDKGFLHKFDMKRLKVMGETLDMWENIREGNPSISDSVTNLLEVRDSIVTSIFHYSKRDLVVKDPKNKGQIFSHPRVNVGLSLVGEELPAIISEDFGLLDEVRNDTKQAVTSFKSFIKSEVHKFVQSSHLYQEKWTDSKECQDLKFHIREQIRRLKSAFETKINELHEKKAELKYTTTGAILIGGFTGLLLSLVSNPAVGTIATVGQIGLGIHHFGQKWITLKNQEASEQKSARSSEIGLFLRFEELKKA